MSVNCGQLTVSELRKQFGSSQILHDVSFEVNAGEFITLLGPSGSGKTTTLRIIAGFMTASNGRVILDGADLTDVPPHRRDIGMVFQNYALFPHLTVARNIAFPLEMRGLPKATIKQKVEVALDLVQLAGFGGRKPQQLSGGQQQRIALARALVFEPRLLLMDEPLGALDRQLRESMQIEIMKICRKVGHTAVYVTHDQEEALAMSDRIAVFNAGRVEQIGTPEEIYKKPESLFVATFIGESTTFAGRLQPGALTVGDVALPLGEYAVKRLGLQVGQDAAIVLRPDMLRLRPVGAVTSNSAMATVRGRVESHVYLGTTRKYVVALEGGQSAVIRTPAGDSKDRLIAPGQEVDVSWDVNTAVVVPLTADGAAPPPKSVANDHQTTTSAPASIRA